MGIGWCSAPSRSPSSLVVPVTDRVTGHPGGVIDPVAGYRGTMRNGTRSRGGSIVGTLLAIWLVIGVLAAFQRGYFSSSDTNCAEVSTTLVTIVAGPLNYVGVNPQVDCPQVPQPSK
jgi:hypothetical protein